MRSRRRYETVEKTRIALNSITPKDTSELIRDAAYLIKGTNYSNPHELLNEAYLRCLDLRRPWPRHVAIKTFLFFSMKSISSEDHLPQSYLKECSLQEFEETCGGDAISFLGGVSPSAEDIYFQNVQRKAFLSIAIQIREHFKNDPHVTFIIDSWLDDMKNSELLKESGMSAKEYDSARKRISRHLKGKKSYYRSQLE